VEKKLKIEIMRLLQYCNINNLKLKQNLSLVIWTGNNKGGAMVFEFLFYLFSSFFLEQGHDRITLWGKNTLFGMF
jgi:hypothetical protein